MNVEKQLLENRNEDIRRARCLRALFSAPSGAFDPVFSRFTFSATPPPPARLHFHENAAIKSNAPAAKSRAAGRHREREHFSALFALRESAAAVRPPARPTPIPQAAASVCCHCRPHSASATPGISFRR